MQVRAPVRYTGCHAAFFRRLDKFFPSCARAFVFILSPTILSTYTGMKLALNVFPWILFGKDRLKSLIFVFVSKGLVRGC